MGYYCVKNLIYQVHEYGKNFHEASSLCVDGWRFPTIKELQQLAKVYYIPGNKISLNGHHKNPKYYWLKGVPEDPFEGGGYLKKPGLSGLFNFEHNSAFHLMGRHEEKRGVILVKKNR